ncbi:unnamed protein product [Rotaria sp. Silwood1]|nr:unnamed protein product [Rotaria sp. Silwood1]CAF4016398.1 unnamed protein product [Rotaria sp. Silwood1]
MWEEQQLSLLFRVLLRDPHLSFIDVGANIGVYTMFAAALRRFTIAIECFKPNIIRIVKAIQLENVQKHVVLIENAVFSKSGQYVQLESIPDNIGSQAIYGNISIKQSLNDTFIAKTIRFDDILPVLQKNHVRSAIMKVDIEGSEHLLCETGHAIFDQFDVPVIQMEWQYVRRYKNRAEIVLNFFKKHHYIATRDICLQLDAAQAFQSWPSDVYWVKMNSSVCTRD